MLQVSLGFEKKDRYDRCAVVRLGEYPLLEFKLSLPPEMLVVSDGIEVAD